MLLMFVVDLSTGIGGLIDFLSKVFTPKLLTTALVFLQASPAALLFFALSFISYKPKSKCILYNI